MDNNINIEDNTISWGSVNTLCIIGNPHKYEEESDEWDRVNKSFQIDSEDEWWNVIEYQGEENFQSKMVEYN